MPISCPNCNYVNRDGARFCSGCRSPLSASLAPMPGMTGMLAANTLLAGRYLIVRKVGQGGMAAVYQVVDTRLANKQWAVKEMSDAAIVDPAQKQHAVDMFQREMELLTRLRHRNIPQVVDTFAQDGKHFIVMEYVDGVTLEELMQSQGGQPCPEAQVKAWLYQLCDVLEYLHAQSPPIIFRDVKPSNIMVDNNGTVKLIDFGIARLLNPSKTHDTQAFGTAGYAAPEQYGQGQTDARTDVYGLGATLYFLLTGYDPSTTPLHLPPLSQFSVQISPAMIQAVQRALENERSRRWASVRELAGALGIQVIVHQPEGSGAVVVPATMPAPRVLRPTTKLLLAVAQMSNQQLAFMGGALAIFFALGSAILTPHISLEMAQAVPLYLLGGPLAYAASQRQWAAGLAHLVVTGTVWLVASQWVRIGDDLPLFITGLLLSSLLMEVLLWLRSKVQPPSDDAPWWQDCAWLAGITAAAGFLALAIPSYGGEYRWIQPWFPFSVAVVGGLGWFLGDLYHQNVLLKQQGLSRSTFRS